VVIGSCFSPGFPPPPSNVDPPQISPSCRKVWSTGLISAPSRRAAALLLWWYLPFPLRSCHAWNFLFFRVIDVKVKIEAVLTLPSIANTSASSCRSPPFPRLDEIPSDDEQRRRLSRGPILPDDYVCFRFPFSPTSYPFMAWRCFLR